MFPGKVEQLVLFPRIPPSSLWLLSSVVWRYLETQESVVSFLRSPSFLLLPPSTLFTIPTAFFHCQRRVLEDGVFTTSMVLAPHEVSTSSCIPFVSGHLDAGKKSASASSASSDHNFRCPFSEIVLVPLTLPTSDLVPRAESQPRAMGTPSLRTNTHQETRTSTHTPENERREATGPLSSTFFFVFSLFFITFSFPAIPLSVTHACTHALRRH